METTIKVIHRPDHDYDLDTTEDPKESQLTFKVTENPPLHIAIFFALQMVISNLPGNVSAVFLIHTVICGGKDYVFLAQMLSTSMVMTGVASFLQVTLGVRLPIAQGSAFSFFPPIMAVMASEAWRCPSDIIQNNFTANFSQDSWNLTDGLESGEEPWRNRVKMVSGGLILASIVQILLGVTGLVGFLTSFIGPITIAPSVMLIGICLFGFVKETSKHQWGVALLTATLMIVFSVVTGNLKIPFPSWNRRKGIHVVRYPLIRIFSNILAVSIAWLLCFVLTYTGCLPDDSNAIGYLARTDAKRDAIDKMDWFYFPYPGQFGAPYFGNVNIFIGMLAATFCSIIESVGDYYATARICGLSVPPKHAINRGIAMEGTASFIGGFVGTCHGTTSLSQMVGFIAYTGVASRLTWMIMSVMLVVIGIFGKLTGALATVPDPVIGGACLLSLGLVISVGISQLHAVDLESTRNQMSLGMALMLGIMVPLYIEEAPSVVSTGYTRLDQIIVVFLRTGPFIGGAVGFVFDNILPGSKKERGMEVHKGPEDLGDEADIYQLSRFHRYCGSYKLFSWIPCLPCYKGGLISYPGTRSAVL